ncbi:MAG: PhzF family phenazine biosynthesis protein, partial [Pseudomonadota bacterium]
MGSVRGMSPSPRPRRFMQCDVFSTDPTRGNGLAVVLEAEGLTDEEMQRFAAGSLGGKTKVVSAKLVQAA